MNRFCRTCTSWNKIAQRLSGQNFGICENIGVAGRVALDGKTHLGEGGTLWTEELFGCNYWCENDKSLVDTSEIVKDYLPKIKSKEIVWCENCNKPNNIINKNCIWCNTQF